MQIPSTITITANPLLPHSRRGEPAPFIGNWISHGTICCRRACKSPSPTHASIPGEMVVLIIICQMMMGKDMNRKCQQIENRYPCLHSDVLKTEMKNSLHPVGRGAWDKRQEAERELLKIWTLKTNLIKTCRHSTLLLYNAILYPLWYSGMEKLQLTDRYG